VIEDRINRGDAAAQLALDVYAHRLRHYLGGYAFALGRLDLVVFTAGVGENSALVRGAATAGLEHFGLELDSERNAVRSKQARIISTDSSPVTIMVVPTDEELAIARKAQQLVG
jgi:acetate kinase